MAITRPHLSSKHINIKKANAAIFAAVGTAVFIVVFGLFAGRALVDQAGYNQRVIGEKKDTLDIARANTENVKELELAYRSFATEAINILGANPEGDGPLDGTNPKIVLDAMPSVYDYPALSSSIEKILLDNGYQIERIGGAEDESLSATNPDASTSVRNFNPATAQSEATEVPYPLTIISSVDGTQRLLDILERSIRPFYVDSLTLTGSDQSLNAKINMKTFYQPGIVFQSSTKVVE